MQDFLPEQIIFDGAGVLEKAFTAATTDIITCAAHGYTGGEKLQFTTSDTLPAGLELATDYYVLPGSVTTNTFKVSTTPDGAAVDVTDTGTGTHTLHLKGKAIYVKGYRHGMLAINTSDSANFTAKVQGSVATELDDVDFNAAQSKSNRWDYLDIVDNEDRSSIDGDTGFAPAGTDDHRQFLLNIDLMNYVTISITSWTAGKLRAGLVLSNG
jgi:hypothetical protein